MPNETIIQNNLANARLTVHWGKQDDPDSKIMLTSWRALTLPDGNHSGEWCPDGSSWNLNREAINKLIRTLRRARDQVYSRDE